MFGRFTFFVDSKVPIGKKSFVTLYKNEQEKGNQNREIVGRVLVRIATSSATPELFLEPVREGTGRSTRQLFVEPVREETRTGT